MPMRRRRSQLKAALLDPSNLVIDLVMREGLLPYPAPPPCPGLILAVTGRLGPVQARSRLSYLLLLAHSSYSTLA